MVNQWAYADPESAAAWVAEFPEGNTRTSALQSLVRQWALNDLHNTANWHIPSIEAPPHMPGSGAFEHSPVIVNNGRTWKWPSSS